MVRHIVALLLIGVWQLQVALPPHIHAGMDADELLEHGQRRHVHLTQKPHADHYARHHAAHDDAAHGHDHSHSHHRAAGHSLAAQLAAATDHDHDAIYLLAASWANASRASVQLEPLDGLMHITLPVTSVSASEARTSAPPRYGGTSAAAQLQTIRLLL